MKILNLGSLNLDKVYQVEHFVSAGETILAQRFDSFCGGKGLNQSVALAKAGAEVYHAGAVGHDGSSLIHTLNEAGVKTKYLQELNIASGHAIIQITPQGQNCIIVCSGANSCISKEYIDEVLKDFNSKDLLLVQNETSLVGYAIRQAKEKGMRVAFNASPVNEQLLTYPLDLIDFFLINEVEGLFLAGHSTTMDNKSVLNAVSHKFPNSTIVLTVGKNGAYCCCNDKIAYHGNYDVDVVDTTAAGDTFCGYFIAAIAAKRSLETALGYASCASNIAVSRCGAAASIPTMDEVKGFMEMQSH